MVSRARSLIEQYRNQSARDLLDKAKERARAAAVQLLSPQPPAQPRHALVRAPARPALGDRPVIDVIGDQEALAGVCATIALRDLNLVDSLLAQLEQLEASEDDPDALAQLYGLDHLATRLRRNAENLRVLAGQEAGGSSDETSSLLDVIRAALSSIEQYPRVEVGRVAPLAVVGFAADDISRLLAELLDNATTQSPPTVTVLVSAHLTERGSVLLRVEDAGIGMPDERQQELNDWLTEPPLLDSGAIEHMGLAVVRRLAHKHNARVTLGRRAPHGTTATVLLPLDLVREAPARTFSRPPGAAQVADHSADDAPQDRRPATVSGLPRRVNRSNSATQLAERPVVAGTTRSGLPRRQSRSLRGGVPAPEPEPEQPPDVTESAEDRARFLDDFAAFTEGEEEARTGQLLDPADPEQDLGEQGDAGDT
jgi:anti-sigma regulatory factor (Ser/Thr protein kinase)